jgi:hypothetical protein
MSLRAYVMVSRETVGFGPMVTGMNLSFTIVSNSELSPGIPPLIRHKPWVGSRHSFLLTTRMQEKARLYRPHTTPFQFLPSHQLLLLILICSTQILCIHLSWTLQ